MGRGGERVVAEERRVEGQEAGWVSGVVGERVVTEERRKKKKKTKESRTRFRLPTFLRPGMAWGGAGLAQHRSWHPLMPSLRFARTEHTRGVPDN